MVAHNAVIDPSQSQALQEQPVFLPLSEAIKSESKMVSSFFYSSGEAPPDADACNDPINVFADNQESDEYSFNFDGGTYRLTIDGVYFVGKDRDGNDSEPVWLSSSLKVIAFTRDVKSNEWGRWLEWKDLSNVTHFWAMPMELLASDGCEVWRELMRQGMLMNNSRFARDRLRDYLQMSEPSQHALCVDRIGWHGNTFVLPNLSIGDTERLTIFQNPYGLEPPFSQSGTLDDWKKNIGQPSRGNSRLILSISMAFAGALLEPTNEESGGIHLRGSSSIGKSTALNAASSVWGVPSKYRRQWRATTNGLEGVALVYNDGLLILDELGQCEPRDAGNSVYMLSNQQGKTRANKTGIARLPASWRLLILSSGEVSLASVMNQAGQRINAGQESRLADVTADAGANMGLFEQLHGTDSPSDFAKTMNNAASTYFGTAGVAWLEYLSKNRTDCTHLALSHIKTFTQNHVPSKAEGQVLRVSRRFALIAAAGEIATEAGITGWMQGEAMDAVSKCFNDWLVNFGGIGNHEERAILSHIRSFIEAHGSSRFESFSADRERISNRVGYFKYDKDGRKSYLIYPEQFKNVVCKGFDPTQVAKVLLLHGWLRPSERNCAACKHYLPDKIYSRMYTLTDKMWAEDEKPEPLSY